MRQTPKGLWVCSLKSSLKFSRRTSVIGCWPFTAEWLMLLWHPIRFLRTVCLVKNLIMFSLSPTAALYGWRLQPLARRCKCFDGHIYQLPDGHIRQLCVILVSQLSTLLHQGLMTILARSKLEYSRISGNRSPYCLMGRGNVFDLGTMAGIV